MIRKDALTLPIGPQNVEPVLALRILCEAWLEGQGKRSKPLNGIIVHAPTKVEDWFRPFGKEASKSAANTIARQMMEGEDAAKAFLEKLARRAKDDTVSWAEFESEVRNLAKALGDVLA